MIMKKLTITMLLMLIFTPLVSAASVFSNPAFDIVLLLIVAFVTFAIIRKIIKEIK